MILFLMSILICIIFKILNPSLDKTNEGSILLYYNNMFLKDRINNNPIRSYIKIW